MNEEIQNFTTLIEGLNARLESFKLNERIFLKAQGLDEQIEKERTKKAELEGETETLKTDLDEQKKQKRDAIRETML